MPFSEFLKFATINVAQNLNRDDLGYIEIGKTADLVLWKDFNNTPQVVMTIINGNIV